MRAFSGVVVGLDDFRSLELSTEFSFDNLCQMIFSAIIVSRTENAPILFSTNKYKNLCL